MTPLSLYFHIPFCRQACAYCDFYFVVSPRSQSNFFAALSHETSLSCQRFFSDPSLTITSIYFGGGTPSWVDPSHILSLLEQVRHLYRGRISAEVEITLEANPDDLSAERLATYLSSGINRISLGIQSFDPNALNYLKRGHDPQQANTALSLLAAQYRQGYLASWNLDLIYGIPGMGGKLWEQQLTTALAASPPHLSLYALTVEPHTPLAHHIDTGIKPSPTDAAGREQYLLATNLLRQKGYHHYEVSNYALPGHHSRHNSHYWSYRDYWGGGPGAHSFYGGKRYRNLPRLNTYIQTLTSEKEGEDPLPTIHEEETLTQVQSYNEYLMVGLRSAAGIQLSQLAGLFPTLYQAEEFNDKIQPFRQRGWMEVGEGRMRLTEEGWLWSDTISRDLFL